MRSKGYNDDILKETGLFFIDERGARDKFWNRVMFPILDVNNRVIGFGGRVMGDGEPKYLNSPETKIFDKSRNLYGLNFARTSRAKYMLICEGYVDAIAAHETAILQYMQDFNANFRILEEPLLVTGIGVAFALNDTRGLDEKLTETLAAMRADGTLKQIVGKYLPDPEKYLEVDALEP